MHFIQEILVDTTDMTYLNQLPDIIKKKSNLVRFAKYYVNKSRFYKIFLKDMSVNIYFSS